MRLSLKKSPPERTEQEDFIEEDVDSG